MGSGLTLKVMKFNGFSDISIQMQMDISPMDNSVVI